MIIMIEKKDGSFADHTVTLLSAKLHRDTERNLCRPTSLLKYKTFNL